jgi:hypothetical protein
VGHPPGAPIDRPDPAGKERADGSLKARDIAVRARHEHGALLAQRHPYVRCTSFDLPIVQPIAARTIQQAGVGDRVPAVGGDFFTEPLPRADVITMSLVLHDRGIEQRRQLVRAAYEALPPGGAFINISHMIGDERRQNVFALLISLSLMLDHGQGSEYTPAEFRAWCTEAGFRSVEVMPLAGPPARRSPTTSVWAPTARRRRACG